VIGLLIVAAVLTCAPASGEDAMPQPTFVAGDTWTYRLSNGAVPISMTILVATSTTYTYELRTPQGTNVATRPLNSLSYGDIEMRWPLTVGKTWTYAHAGAGVSTSVEASVDAREPVTVPAGAFSAFRIKVHACAADASKSVCGDFWMWIDPAVKNAVKITWSNEAAWDDTRLRGASVVLTSYAVTPR
jgi:hypothetical protein